MNMEKKRCGCCKKEYPKTEKYFFRKITRQRLTNGNLVEYMSFRSICKGCHAKKTTEFYQKRRCAELGCDIGDYQKSWRKQYSESRRAYPDITDIPEGQRGAVLKKIRMGYKYTTYKQYKKDCSMNISKARRRHDYGDIEMVSPSMANKKTLEVMTDARVALLMGMSVRDVPVEMLELRRTLIMLKRELGLTHSTKPNKNQKYDSRKRFKF